MLPANTRLGSPTGGGNFYIFKNSTPEERKAAVKFVQWMTTAERAAQWGIDTGYVAVRPDAWKTERMLAIGLPLKCTMNSYPASASERTQSFISFSKLSRIGTSR